MSEKLQQDHVKVVAQDKNEEDNYLLGRGAQFNTKNKFLKDERTREHVEGIDDWSGKELMTGPKKIRAPFTWSRTRKLS
jgi:hypothetical protein